jgi:hypothetical protein
LNTYKGKADKKTLTTENTEKLIVAKKKKTAEGTEKKSVFYVVKKIRRWLCGLCGLGVLIPVVREGLSKMKISVYSVVKNSGVVVVWVLCFKIEGEG